MKFPFNPALGTILVGGKLTGSSGSVAVVLALDTGASGTTINTDSLVKAGYDPTQFPANVSLTTGSGLIYVSRFPVQFFEALGQMRPDFKITAHDLPPSAAVDGVLGLDFFQDQVLTIDFHKGEITLAPGAVSPTP